MDPRVDPRMELVGVVGEVGEVGVEGRKEEAESSSSRAEDMASALVSGRGSI